MDLLLKIIGGLTVAVILLVGSVLFFFWWKLRGIAKGIAASMPTPSTISLEPQEDSSWTTEEPAAGELAALEACGYVRGPAYTVDGIPGVSLVSLHHPATGTYGCYYEHAVAGNWMDLCARFADGLELTVGNPPQGGQLDTRPGTKKILQTGKTPAELHAVLRQEVTGHALKPYSPDKFTEEFCAAYARDMAWRNAKDGTSEEEFMRIAASHKDLSPEQLKEAFKETKLKEIDGWSDEILEAFAKSTTVSVSEWKKYENNMVIFREGFHPAAYLEYLTNTVSLKEGEQERYEQALAAGLSLQGLLDRIAADTGHEFVKLGEVAEPKPTVVYGVKVPEDEESED